MATKKPKGYSFLSSAKLSSANLKYRFLQSQVYNISDF